MNTESSQQAVQKLFFSGLLGGVMEIGLVHDALQLLNVTRAKVSAESLSQPIPSDIDRALVAVAQLVRAMQPKELEQLATAISDNKTQQMLLLFPRRVAVRVLRGAKPELLEDALILSCLDCQKYDWRDSLATLVVIAHVCDKRGLDLSVVMKRVRDHVPLAARDFLLEFSLRPLDSRQLEAFHFEESVTPDGPTIVQHKWS